MKAVNYIALPFFLLLAFACTPAEREVAHGDPLPPSLKVGVSYYPEQRPRESWNVDFEYLVRAGIQRIRIGEFAWSTLEPRAGVYDYHCFDDCIELARRYGIEVVMCTPTAAPPAWLVSAHPEILPVNSDGQRNVFGARQHRCYNAPAYLESSRKIVEQLADRYARHPNVVAWQIDNEMGGEQKRCHCSHCREAFQEYLRRHYQDVESLNHRWGNAFWSLDYQDFSQVVLPMRYNATLMLKHHPSLELEFSRFSSASIVNFCRMQSDLIREINPDALVTTNRFAYEWGDNVQVAELNRELDAAGFDLYSNKPHHLAFYADVNRSLSPGRSWVLEYGTGSPDLGHELALMESRGVSWIYLFKLNPFPSGMEQSNRALLDITDQPTANYELIRRWNEGKLPGLARPGDPASTGIFYDFDCSWALAQEGWGSYREKLVYQAYLIDTVYQAIFDPGSLIRVVHDSGNFKDLSLLILPHQVIHRPGLEVALLDFISEGGTVICTHDLFWKNPDNVYLTAVPDIYEKVMGRTQFILDAPDSPGSYPHGLGKLVVVPAGAGLAQWKEYAKEYIH